MRHFTPQVAWHGKDPIYTVDFQQTADPNSNSYRLVTAGSERYIKVWKVIFTKSLEDNREKFELEFVSNLSKCHDWPVNIAKISPRGDTIGSADTKDPIILLWKLNEAAAKSNAPNIFGDESDEFNKEWWVVAKRLRGHTDEVLELVWSSDASLLVSGSNDKSIIVWNSHSGCKVHQIDCHKQYPQGVCIDFSNRFVASMGADRTFHIHDIRGGKCKRVAHLTAVNFDVRAPADMTNDAAEIETGSNETGVQSTKMKIFLDDTALQHFFRRLSFTPDGSFLLAPAGCVDIAETRIYTTWIFQRNSWTRPCSALISPNYATVAVRCCPVYFELRRSEDEDPIEPHLNLPYRFVFAVITKREVLIYDTQQTMPLSYLTDVHYCDLTDASWSSDGRALVVSSVDGYCTFVRFDEGELGTLYDGPPITPSPSPTTLDRHLQQINLQNRTLSAEKIDSVLNSVVARETFSPAAPAPKPKSPTPPPVTPKANTPLQRWLKPKSVASAVDQTNSAALSCVTTPKTAPNALRKPPRRVNITTLTSTDNNVGFLKCSTAKPLQNEVECLTLEDSLSPNPDVPNADNATEAELSLNEKPTDTPSEPTTKDCPVEKLPVLPSLDANCQSTPLVPQSQKDVKAPRRVPLTFVGSIMEYSKPL